MVTITLSNAKRIVLNGNIKDLNLKGNIYKTTIYFFSKYEQNQLLAIREFLKDPDNYFKEVYQPIVGKQDTFTYIYEGRKPAYHKSANCPMVGSNYSNFLIPEAIKEKGEDVVRDFRKWFETVKHLLDENKAAFNMRLKLKWDLEINLKGVEKDNSGFEDVNNYDLSKLEDRIDQLIKEAGRFYYDSPKNTAILKAFSKLSYLGNSKQQITKNSTGYSDEEVKALLKDYDKRFKRPLMTLLIEYYRLTLNPDIKLEGTLLDQLGFKRCQHCFND